MRKICAITTILVAFSFMARADEPKKVEPAKKAEPAKKMEPTKATPAKVEPVKVEPAKVAVPVAPVKKRIKIVKATAPASQPVVAAPVVAPKADPKVAPKAEPTPAPVPTPAPAPAVQKWWQEGLSELVKVLGSILIILIGTLVTVLAKKYGFESYQAILDDVLHRSVNYVEQITVNKLGEGQEKTPGAKKMEMAIEIAKKLAANTKLKDKGTEWWQTQLESWLGATGSSKTNGTA